MMKIKKDLIIVALATFCLTATLFMIRTSWSGSDWDPWVDIKEDGTVDIYDAISLANAYGTSGDTTKNVTVTNWPVKRTLNASLADNWVIDGSQAWQLEANVEGYSKVTLVMKMETSSGMLSVDVRFKIGGVLTPSVYRNYTQPTGYCFLLQNYEVIGPTIEIELEPSGTVRIWVGIYATD
jgi:hypothetical protein